MTAGQEQPRRAARLRGRWVILPMLVIGVLIGFFGWFFFGPNTFPDANRKIFNVSKGQYFGEIVDSLAAQGIIRDRTLFILVGRLYGGTSSLKVGRYGFESGVSNSEIYLRLRSGRENLLITVTVPEGLFARAQARLFSRALGIDSSRYMSLVHDGAFVQSLGIAAQTLEGYLLPQTYGFSWQQDERDIITAQVEGLQAFLTDSLEARAHEIGMTRHQVMTLASIVEGEAVVDEERPIIAGVYFNRLRKRMKLEADPTIQFVLPDGPRRVYYLDLRIDSPYNTYRFAGLPPGPVNNPGTESILATLYPARHNYLFFVANGRGGHWFSSTYAEHLKNVRRYRKERARGFQTG